MGSIIDLTGRRFGKLTVLQMLMVQEQNRRIRISWNCLCECEQEKVIVGASLTRKVQPSQSYGKCQQAQDLTGKQFGKLLVLNKNTETEKKGWNWDCVCECGTRSVVGRYSLLRRNTNSCGSTKRERIIKRNK
ncbi:hypothetical protein [Neobacillus drentensis]|uniref:hypothetical protein n=1 Tax=Neobacillus drentensis TaxID=220684 RepID=UPI002FFF3245